MALDQTIQTPNGLQTVAQINAARAAAVDAGKDPYAGTGATNTSVSAGLGNPAVITSDTASNHLQSTIIPHVTEMNASITAQNARLEADKAAQQAAAQAQAEKEQQAKAAALKAQLDQQNADMKAAALKAAGTGGPLNLAQTQTNGIKNDQPYADVNGANPNDWRSIAKFDGTRQVVTRTQNMDGTYSYTPVAPKEITAAQNQATLDQANAEYKVQSDLVSKTIANIANGTIPLNAGEQAQVNALQQSYQNLIQQQTLQNTNAQGLANIRGYQTGAAEYDPTFQAKTIGSIVTAGLNKIGDLNIKMAGAVAELTDKLKKNDIANIKSAWDTYNTAATKRIETLQKTIDNAQKAITDAQTAAMKEKEYQLDVSKFKEEQDKNAFDKLYKTEELKLKYSGVTDDNGVSGKVPAVGFNRAGTGADPVAQKEFLATLPEATRLTVQGLLDYTANPANLSTRSIQGKPSQRQIMLELAHKADPTFDESQYANRAAYSKKLQSGTLADAIIAANKSINHLDAFTKDVEALHNGPTSAAINEINLGAQKLFGKNRGQIQQSAKAAETEANGLKDEMAKFFKGSGATDVKSIEDWSKSLDINATPAQRKGLVEGAITLLAGQLDTIEQQYRATMGKDPKPGQFIQPDTLRRLSDLKNRGYKVEIPGVPYTDKDAYLKNGGSMEELKAARQALIDANDPDNPPTPENVLEYAQLGADSPPNTQSFNMVGNTTASIGNLPQRNNNPGDVKSGGVADSLATGRDSQGHLIFPTIEAGFKALALDLKAKISGQSKYLPANPTLAQLGKVYAEDANWPKKVASFLGVPVTTATSTIPFDDLVHAIARQEGFYANT